MEYYNAEQWSKIEENTAHSVEQLSSLNKKFDLVVAALQRSADITNESARAFWNNANWVSKEEQVKEEEEGRKADYTYTDCTKGSEVKWYAIVDALRSHVKRHERYFKEEEEKKKRKNSKMYIFLMQVFSL